MRTNLNLLGGVRRQPSISAIDETGKDGEIGNLFAGVFGKLNELIELIGEFQLLNWLLKLLFWF